jgi:NRAMP (natural resistance-associated macrophage protein)-like metal ion transporter
MSSKKNNKNLKDLFKNLGPGLITGASDDDPSGIATYSQAGAQFGLATLWTALITFPLMFGVQEICARIGLVTSNGLAANIKNYYSKPLLYFTILLMIPALIANISANIASMGAVSHLLIPAFSPIFFSTLISILLLSGMIFLPYKKIVSVLKYLCLSLFLYIIVPFLNKQDFLEILKNSFIPTLHFNREFISILVAILGTTISPYLFFWQTTMAAESHKHERIYLNKKRLSFMVKDVGIGMLCSNVVMYFIILTTGTILFQNGFNNIVTVEQAAKALEPLAGDLSYFLFSLGILSTGFLSLPVLSGCLSYILCTALNCNEGLNEQFKRAKIFYSLIILSILIGLGLNFIGFNPIKSLIFAAILNCLISPPLLILILLIGNNSKIMGKHVNGLLSNCLAIITLLLMSSSSLALVYFLWIEKN